METNRLDLIEISNIEGTFTIEAYQRGYRWGKVEVECLLEDIYTAVVEENAATYCLQPIVVKKTAEHRYELIDGQQRLTTIFLIYRYISVATNGALSSPNISIDYVTRKKSKEYLESLDRERSEEYIDFYFMYKAYKTIEEWFETKANGVKNVRTNIAFRMNDAFVRNVKIIWYEVDSDEDSEKLFARLNIGRIPLTCAELVKAMFLNSACKLSEHKRDEIAMQWDNIERELRDDSFWYFLTNKNEHDDNTRIELVLDLMAGKKSGERDKLYTFLSFSKREKNGESLEEIWLDINRTFLLLKGWYKNRELYHKIGFLIAAKISLSDIFALAFDGDIPRTKTQFSLALYKKICEIVRLNGDHNYGDLRYTSDTDYKQLRRLILLFNIMKMDELGDRFPFEKFKNSKKVDSNGQIHQIVWSLEHIHAQHSQGLSKLKEWQCWLSEHAKEISGLHGDEKLIAKMNDAAKDPNLTRDEFVLLHDEAVKLLSPENESATLHNISNLALLDVRNNAALNDATFSVKRRIIIGKDSNDEYIPFCTKMVFLKYFSSEVDNMYYWSQKDRESYIKNINDLLYKKYKYIDKEILIGQEEEE